jgi:hypothetical protein
MQANNKPYLLSQVICGTHESSEHPLQGIDENKLFPQMQTRHIQRGKCCEKDNEK